MTYGTIKVDTVTFTDAGIDKSVTLSGLVQNPTFSGNVTVTGTLSGVTVTGTTANFTSGNFTNISGGTHTITSGVFAAGSAASPSITFTGDLNTGIYSPGADQVAISTNSSGRLFIDANGHIGLTASASAWGDSANGSRAIQIGGSSWYNYRTSIVNFGHGYYYDASDNYRYVYTGVPVSFSQQTAGEHRWFGASSGTAGNSFTPLERMRLDSSGRLGVGTSSPGGNLDVRGVSGTPIIIAQGTDNNGDADIRIATTGSTGASRLIFSDTAGSNGSIIYRHVSDSLALGTNGNTNALFIDSSGRLGIGTTSPVYPVTIFNATNNFLQFSKSGDAVVGSLVGRPNGFAELRLQNSENEPIAFLTNNTERARIDSSGRLLVGTSTSTSTANVGATQNIQVQGSSSLASVTVIGNAASSIGGYLTLAKSRSTTAGGFNVVTQGDELGAISFEGADGSAYRVGASIGCVVDGTPGTNDMPGRLVFSTTADGATSPTERLRITSAGLVGVGTSSPAGRLHIAGYASTNQSPDLQISRSSSGTAIQTGPNINFADGTTNNTTTLQVTQGRFGVWNYGSGSWNERFCVTPGGLVGIGTTSPGSPLQVNGAGGIRVNEDGAGTNQIQLRSDWAGQGPAINVQTNQSLIFTTNATERVRIDTSGRLGIGTASAQANVHIAGSSPTLAVSHDNTGSGGYTAVARIISINGANFIQSGSSFSTSAAPLIFSSMNAGTEWGRWDVSGRLLVGLSSAPSGSTVVFSGNGSNGSTGDGRLYLNRGSTPANAEQLGATIFSSNNGANEGASLQAVRDGGTWTAGSSHPTRLVFSTTADGASSPTERLRITSAGLVGVGTSALPGSGKLQVAGDNASTSIGSVECLTLLDGNASNEFNILNFATSVGGTIARIGAKATTTGGYPNSVGELHFAVQNGGSTNTALVIDSSSRVGIGTTSAQESLHVVSATDNQGAIIENSTSRASLTVKSAATTSSSYVNFGNPNGNSRAFIDYRESLNRLLISTSTASGELVFATGSQSERFRCDSSGRLLVGTSSTSSENCTLQVRNNSALAAEFFTSSDDTAGPYIHLTKSRGTAGSPTEVSSGDTLGAVAFLGYDGASYRTAVRITAEADGTWTDGGDTTDNPGRLVFSTTADGASSPTERMRISSSGQVFFGKTADDNSTGITLATLGNAYIVRDGGACLGLNRLNSDGTIASFARSSTTVGTISVTTTATAYNTSSDYRLKENVIAVTDGITRLQQLKPSRFNFIADPAKTVDGFIAHEVQTVVPEAITGEKDAVDEDGNPIYQGIDQSKLVPLLTAALQEAVAKIESLEARLTAAGI